MRTTERRTSPRVSPRRPVKAKIKSAIPARVVDVSSNGMQIELEAALRVGASCDVRVVAEGTERSLRATVRRCHAWGFALDDNDRRVLVYRAGIEFEEMSPDCLNWLRATLLVPEGGAVGAPPGQAAGDEVRSVAPTDEPPPATDAAAGPAARPPRSGPVKIRIDSAAVRRILEPKKS